MSKILENQLDVPYISLEDQFEYLLFSITNNVRVHAKHTRNCQENIDITSWFKSEFQNYEETVKHV